MWIVLGVVVLSVFAGAAGTMRRGRHRRERQLLDDPVTGLPNRRALFEALHDAWRELDHDSDGRRIVVSVVALKQLKTIGDAFGQEYADRVLVDVYDRMSAVVPGVTVTRLDGDELAGFMVSGADVDTMVAALSERLKLLAPPIEIGGRVVVVHCCAGLAAAEPGEPPDETLRNARLALQKARQAGNAAVCSYEPRMYEELTRRLALERDFERALAAGEFEVHYQPIVRTDDGRPTGVEALVRWRHSERGLLAPDAFIELAEASGFIVPLGTWILSEACGQVRKWQLAHEDLAALTVHVNVSSRQLEGRYFAAHVRGVLAETGLRPSDLTVELTESAIADGETANRLRELVDFGISLALDDFGTGYSSLAYLDRLPVHSLKIDRQFVDGIDTSDARSTVVGLVTRLGAQLDLRTVAEGVERSTQLQTLRALGCREAQGYLFARPAPPGQAERTLLELASRAKSVPTAVVAAAGCDGGTRTPRPARCRPPHHDRASGTGGARTTIARPLDGNGRDTRQTR